MPHEGKVYKMIDLVGTSPNSIEEAIQTAVARASETLKGLDWVQVSEIRGLVKGDRVVEFQVLLKLGFQVMRSEQLS
ncbi:MAG TPA: dodecin [Dehalococcoidia bacterium]|jgi:flavin-binding protein dodecin|nr:dodecin [Dehalococcoidia bacterium]HXF50167.1 dodecin [Dehalococcoidia bacterium]